MAITGVEYPLSYRHGFEFLTDTIKVALLTSSYTYNAAHEFFSDLTAEVVGSGYTAGGETLTGAAASFDTPSATGSFTFTNPAWTGASFTCRSAAFYKSTGVAGTSPLYGLINFGSDVVPTSGTLTLTIPGTGLFRVQLNPVI